MYLTVPVPAVKSLHASLLVAPSPNVSDGQAGVGVGVGVLVGVGVGVSGGVHPTCVKNPDTSIDSQSAFGHVLPTSHPQLRLAS